MDGETFFRSTCRECLVCGDRWPNWSNFATCPDCDAPTKLLREPPTVSDADANEALEKIATQAAWRRHYEEHAVRAFRAELDAWNAECELPEPSDGPTAQEPPSPPKPNFGLLGGVII